MPGKHETSKNMCSTLNLLRFHPQISQAQWSSYKSQRNLPPPAPAAQASSFTTKFYEFEQPAPLYPQPPYPAQPAIYSPPSNTIEDYSSLIKLVKTLSKSQPEKDNSCNTGDIINKLIDALIVAVAGKNQTPTQQSSRNSDSDE